MALWAPEWLELNEFQVCVHEGYHAFSLAVYNITTSIMYSYVPSDAEILILSVLQVRCFSAPLPPTDFFWGEPTEISGVKRVVQEKMPEV